MFVLNIEDSVYKHNDIKRALASCKEDIDLVWAKCLEEGMDYLRAARNTGKPYDLVITDWYYPIVPGGNEQKAGELLIAKMKAQGFTTPIIVCSSARLVVPEAVGCVHYSRDSDWDADLVSYVEMGRLWGQS